MVHRIEAGRGGRGAETTMSTSDDEDEDEENDSRVFQVMPAAQRLRGLMMLHNSTTSSAFLPRVVEPDVTDATQALLALNNVNPVKG